MKAFLLVALTIATLTPDTCLARFVTLAIGGGMTNASTVIREFETVRIVSGRDSYQSFYLHIQRTNATIRLFSQELMGISPNNVGGHPRNDMVVSGPAHIILFSGRDDRPPIGLEAAYVTLEIVPESFPPDRTIVIPEGGGANIALECSTNLIDWTAAPLGVYTNQPTVKFFRLKAERVP